MACHQDLGGSYFDHPHEIRVPTEQRNKWNTAARKVMRVWLDSDEASGTHMARYKSDYYGNQEAVFMCFSDANTAFQFKMRFF